MSEKTMRDAINEALHQAMAEDDSVFVIGEDVAGCNGAPSGKVGEVGGVFGSNFSYTPVIGLGHLFAVRPQHDSALSLAAQRFFLCGCGEQEFRGKQADYYKPCMHSIHGPQ